MNKLLTTLGLIAVALFCGQLLKFITRNSQGEFNKPVDKLRLFAFLILNPIVMVNSYWIIDFSNLSMLAMPIICVVVLFVSGMIGMSFSKHLGHDCHQRGAMFGCSTFSNLGTVGGLIVFSFLGESAFAIAAMYFFFESFYNYLFAYPLVKTIGEGGEKMEGRLKSILSDPAIIIYVSAIFVGLALNFLPIDRPQFMADYNNLMIPVISFLLIFTISYKMEFGKIGKSFKEGLIVVGIKYVISPAIALGLGYVCGLHTIADGLVMKVLAIMSLTPCGFNSILVPTIYKVDKDLANSGWIMSMIALIILIPIEYLIFA